MIRLLAVDMDGTLLNPHGRVSLRNAMALAQLQEEGEMCIRDSYIFAKGKLSYDMAAVEPEINTERFIKIVNGRHPFLDPAACVPLNFRIGGEIRGVVITGPNTGGKTDVYKRKGLWGWGRFLPGPDSAS